MTNRAEHLSRAKYKIMPWKNGLGVTAEIDRHPAGEGPYLWRLSQATLQSDAPFSAFNGFDRWLAVWQGASIFLNDRELKPQTPHRFSGDELTTCRLSGARVEDIGLIFDRAQIDAAMTVVEGKVQLQANRTHYLFDLQSGDTLKIEGAAEMKIEKCFLISVWRR